MYYYFCMVKKIKSPFVPSTSSNVAHGSSVLAIAFALILSGATPASASPYAVPESGLSFDTTDTVESDVCTTGYGNVLTDELGDPLTDDLGDPIPEDDEINYLIQGESVTYLNVAEIDGDSIDARVTLSDILGMASQEGRPDDSTAPVLERLDKCEEGDGEAGLIEAKFDSAEFSPSESYFELTIDFLVEGSPVTLNDLIMNVEDIDSNQFLEVDDFNSVRLADNRGETDVQEYSDGEVIDVDGSPVTVNASSPTALRFFASGSSDSSDGAEETDKHVVELTYSAVDSIVLRLGAYENGGGSFDLNFSGFEFASDSDEPELAPTGPASSMWGLAIGSLGFLIAGAVLRMQAVRRRSLTAG